MSHSGQKRLKKPAGSEHKVDSPRLGNRRWFVLAIATFVLALAALWLGTSVINLQRDATKTTSVIEPAVAATSPRVSHNDHSSATERATNSDDGPIETEPPLPHVPTTAKVPTAKELEIDQPLSEGWDTEAISAQATAQLKRIAKSISKGKPIKPADLAELAADRFGCGPLLDSDLSTVFQDPAFTVRRANEKKSSSTGALDHARHSGASGLASALNEFTSTLREYSQTRAKFKLFRIDKSESAVTTEAYYEASGQSGQQSLQQNATWRCRWTRPRVGEAPQLLSIELRDYEQVETKDPPTLFADCTESVLNKIEAYRSQFTHGGDYWCQRLETQLGVTIYGHHGLALGDVNGDGLDDIYVCQPGGLPNQLWLGRPDGTLSDASEQSGVQLQDLTASALLVDLDSDADQDLAVTVYGMLLVYANDGQAHFTKRFQMRNRLPGTLSAADYDNDGLLDIYLCNYNGEDTKYWEFPVPIPYHAAENGGSNILLRNEGDLQFRNVTAQVGLDQNNTRYSFTATWEDFDNDGDQDLYVANDFGRNNLYRNDLRKNGRFVDVAPTAGVEDIASGMSASWGDYNNDGQMDIYVSNMFSAAGNRVAYQRQFNQSVSTTTKALLQRAARGNTLFANQGDGTFRDESVSAAVTMGRWSWASLFTDINNDSWDDLIVLNGMVTTENTADL